MICYLVNHQDKRNRIGKLTKIKEAILKRGGNKKLKKTEEFFMHVDMKDDEMALNDGI